MGKGTLSQALLGCLVASLVSKCADALPLNASVTLAGGSNISTTILGRTSPSLAGIVRPTTFIRDASSAIPTATTDKIVILTTSGSSTWSETFLETSLSKFATVTGPTTFTTTDSSGDVALGVAFAGGLAWMGVPAAVPPINPPLEIPDPTPMPELPTLTEATSTSSSSSSSSSISSRPRGTQKPIIQIANPNSKANAAAVSAMLVVPNNAASCSTSGSVTVDRNQALPKLQAFCLAQDGKVIDGTDANFQQIDMGAGIVLQTSLSVNNVCSGVKVTSTNATCAFFYQELLDSCDTNTLQKHGGTVDDGCVIYNADPVEYQGNLTCHGPTSPNTGVQRAEALSNIQDFCKRNSGSNVGPGGGNLLTYPQSVGNNQAVISVVYSDSCTRQGSPTYQIDETACNRFLTQTIDGCDTATTTAKFGGNLTDHCGVFKFDTQVTEKVTCGGKSVGPPVPFNLQDGMNAINDYCGEDLTLDPAFQSPTSFSQSPPKGSSYDNFVKGLNNIVIRMNATFAADQLGCPPKKAFSTKGSECVRKLTGVLNGCDTQTTAEKNGGFLVDKSPNGCVQWSIFAQSTVN